jgi:HlyD family secretion protein
MMAKDACLRFQRPADVVEALAPFAHAKSARYTAALVGEVNNREDSARPLPSALPETQSDRTVPLPSVRTPLNRRQRWVKFAAILAAILLYYDLFGMESLWLRSILYLAPLLALFPLCAWAFGIITLRQFFYALLALLLGVTGAEILPMTTGVTASVVTLLIGCGVALGIITFGLLDTLVRTTGITFGPLKALVRATRIRTRVYLATSFAGCAAAIAFAGHYQVVTKVNGEGILLTENDVLSLVRAQATGRLVSFRVKSGDWVSPGNEVGQISQDDLKDAIREAESKVNDLRREDQERTQIEQTERENNEAVMAREQRAVLMIREDSVDKLKTAQREMATAERLLVEKHPAGDQTLREARENLDRIKDNLNRGESRLKELAQTRIGAENARHGAQLERRRRIQQLESKLTADREKLTRASSIVVRVRGRVDQFLVDRDEVVREGEPVILVHAPQEQTGLIAPYSSIIFVPASEGKRINLGDFVEVVPAGIKREEHGFIRARVVDIGELPATKRTMEEALGHPALVDAFFKRDAPSVLLRVQFDFASGDRNRQNPFRWSSSSGADQPLKTGTLCQAAIIVERRSLLSLFKAWIAKFVVID